MCTACGYGKMPTPNGMFCTDWLDHCNIPLANQPTGLTPSDDLFWVCNDCDKNFYFDGLICTECNIDHCEDCSD